MSMISTRLTLQQFKGACSGLLHAPLVLPRARTHTPSRASSDSGERAALTETGNPNHRWRKLEADFIITRGWALCHDLRYMWSHDIYV